MRKILSVLIILCLLPQMCTAAVLGNSIYTDIATYINHYPIPSYHFKNLTLIVAEDLENYGFNVKWNEYAQSLTITRNKDKKISELVTFRPETYLIGQKNLTITDTHIKVFYKSYRYYNNPQFYQLSAFYGYVSDTSNGKILINVDDLSCFDNTTVVWCPDIKAMKVWIEDGMPVNSSFDNLRRFDWNIEVIYTGTFDDLGETYYWYEYADYPTAFVLSLAETLDKNKNVYVIDYDKTVEIIKVIDADGNSILKTKPVGKGTSPSAYATYFTSLLFSSFAILTKDDLMPRTASDPGGLITFKYGSYRFGTITITVRVEQLPYGE